jgi:hypothetical protein
MHNDNQAVAVPNASASTTSIFQRLETTSGVRYSGIAQGFDADGFEMNMSGTTAAAEVQYLCLKFTNSPNVAVFSTSIPTSGDYAETSPGFEPTFGLTAFMGGLSSSNTSSDTTGIRASITPFTGSSVFCNRIFDQDAADPTNTSSTSNASGIILHTSTGTTDANTGNPTFDSTGWTTTPSDYPASIVYGWGFAIGRGTELSTEEIIYMRRKPNTPLIAM